MTGACGKKRAPSLGTSLLNAPYVLWAALFIIIPLLIVVYYTFAGEDGGFTLDNIVNLRDYLPVFGRSFLYSLIATALSLVVAYPLAYFICGCGAAGQKLAIMFVTLPMFINLLIRTYCLMTLMDNNGILNQFIKSIGLEPVKMLNTPGAVIFGMVYNYLPYMVLPIYNVMSKIDKPLLEAAEDLGCNAFARVRRIILPLSLPGVISGIIMVFVPSISTFYISSKMGGTNNWLIGDQIENEYLSGDLSAAAALSMVLMVVILLSMFIMNRFSKDDEGGAMLV